ncbi:MAG: PTS sugar transporter subunit IIA [Pseudomonadota bacterium]
MELSDFIASNAVLVDLKVTSKKQLLTALSEDAGLTLGIESRDIFDTLLQREKLGSTGIGDGVAIPHGKLRSIDAVFGLIATLASPIEFDAPDDKPIDIVFVLLAPENAGADHLKALARIARFVKSETVLDQLRSARTKETVRTLIKDASQLDAA